MQKHLSTFLYITIGSISIAVCAMEKPEISKRVFPRQLSTELTQEEQETKNELFGLLTQKLATQFAAAQGISILNAEREQIMGSAQEESSAQILETHNIKPSQIKSDLKETSPECIQYLRDQIKAASEESERKNAIRQALKQEKARQKQIALGSHKKVMAPTIVKDLIENTFAATQSAQLVAPEATSTLLTMPTLKVKEEPGSQVAFYSPEVFSQELPSSVSATPTYENLDDLLASLEDAIPQKSAPKKANKEIDQLLADLESFGPQSTNPLYEEPTTAELEPIEQVEVDVLSSKLAEISRQVTELSQNARIIFEDMDPKTTNKETLRQAHTIFIKDVTGFNQEIDKLSHYLNLQPKSEGLSAFTRLKLLAKAFKSSAEHLGKTNQNISCTVPFISYTACLDTLLATISEAN